MTVSPRVLVEITGERLCGRHPAGRLVTVGVQHPVAAPVLEYLDKWVAATITGRVERLADVVMAARKVSRRELRRWGVLAW